MIFQDVLLICLLGCALLGGLTAYGRPWLERVILLATIPLAWVVGTLLLKAGLGDFVGSMVLELLKNQPEISAMLEDAPAVAAGAAGVINGLVRILVLVPLFLALLLLQRIAYAIVVNALKLREKSKLFQSGDKKAVLKNLGSGAIGAVGGFVICMLLLMPIHFMSDLLTPTMETFEDEQFNGTYVAAQAEQTGTALLPLGKQTLCGKLQTYTGLRAVMNATADELCTVSFVNIHGDKVKFNGRATLAVLIKDAALGLTLYEYSCNPYQYTVGDFALAAQVVEDLAEQEALLAMAQELLVWMSESREEEQMTEPEEAESSGLTETLTSMLEGYKTAPTVVLQTDLYAVAELLRSITTDMESVSVEDVALQNLIFDYLADEDATYRVVTALSKIHVYGQLLSELTKYGIGMLSEILGISADKKELHETYLQELQRVLGDRSVGSYDLADVNTYILAHVGETGTAAELPAHVVEAYERYCSRIRPLLEVLGRYTDSDGEKLYFVGNDRICYVYDAENDLWRFDNNVLAGGAYLAQLLLEEADAYLQADENTVIDEVKLMEMISAVEGILRMQDVSYAAQGLQLAETVRNMDSESFAPDAICSQDILDGMNTGLTFGEAENRQFAGILSTAGGLFSQLMAEANGEMSMDAIMENFPMVGRLLDGFSQFEMTAQVSELLLLAVMENAQFAEYFSAESVQALIENVRDGSTTYEQLFRYIRTLYNILDQTNPAASMAG